MELYATFSRNVHGTGGNQSAWRLKVFGGGTERADDVIYVFDWSSSTQAN